MVKIKNGRSHDRWERVMNRENWREKGKKSVARTEEKV